MRLNSVYRKRPVRPLRRTGVLARLAALVFVALPAGFLPFLGLAAFRGAGPGVLVPGGAVARGAPSLVVPAVARLGGHHPPALHGRFGGVRGGLEDCWGWDRGWGQVWGEEHRWKGQVSYRCALQRR